MAKLYYFRLPELDKGRLEKVPRVYEEKETYEGQNDGNSRLFKNLPCKYQKVPKAYESLNPTLEPILPNLVFLRFPILAVKLECL